MASPFRKSGTSPRPSDKNVSPRPAADALDAAGDAPEDDANPRKRTVMSALQSRTKNIMGRFSTRDRSGSQAAPEELPDPAVGSLAAEEVDKPTSLADKPLFLAQAPMPETRAPGTPGTTRHAGSAAAAQSPGTPGAARKALPQAPASGVRGSSGSLSAPSGVARDSATLVAEDGRGGYDLHAALPLPSGFVNRFRVADADDNLLFLPETARAPGSDLEEIPKIRGGTLVKLVERLTFQDHGDPDFVKVFLLTYRSFTTPAELLALLMNRFLCPLEDESDLERKRSFQKPIRLRVFSVLKAWISNCVDFISEDDENVQTLQTFCKEHVARVMPSGSRQLLTLLDKSLSHELAKKRSLPISSKDIPRPHLPQCRPSEISLLTVHPQEIARQLTIIEAELFQAIKPWELLNLAWSRKNKEEKAPNVLAMIGRANVLSPWIGHQIVSARSLKVRVELLTRCIEVMCFLEELHNYNALMELIAALTNSGVRRLKETWAQLSKKSRRMWDLTSARMSRDNNFKNFRDSLRTVSPPSIPFLGLYLQDLTFIEDGNPNFLDEEKGLINMAKRAQYSQLIMDIQMYQQTPYLLQPVPLVSDWLRGIPAHTAESVYDASLLIKGRDKDAKELDDDTATIPSNFRNTPEAVETPSEWGDIANPPDYPFSEPDSDENIVLSDENHKVVVYATIPKLVERLTYERHSDPTFVSAFLLTHRLMMDSSQLADLLIQRYNVPFPVRTDADLVSKFEVKVVRPIRLRVFNALKQWVDKWPMDFAQDPEMAKRLTEFAETTMRKTSMEKPAERLSEGLAAAVRFDGESKKLTRRQGGKPPPAPIYPKAANLKEVSVMDIAPLEIARQLTLMEFSLYFRVVDREVLMWHHAADSREADCPNVWALNQHHQWLERWTLSLLLLHEMPSTSVPKAIGLLIAVADSLWSLNNFSSCQCVVNALSHPAVASLDAWVALSSKAAKLFESLKDSIEEIRTYSKHQQWLQKVSAPALPSLSSCLEELQRINVSLPDSLSADIHPSQLISFDKRLRQAKVVTDYLAFQATDFSLDEVADFVALFRSEPLVPEDASLGELVEKLNRAAEEEAEGNADTIKSRVQNAVATKFGVAPRLTTKSPSLASIKTLPVSPRPNRTASVASVGESERSDSEVSPRFLARRNTGNKPPVPGELTKEWVQELVARAVEEAVEPLRVEIADLRKQLGEMQALVWSVQQDDEADPSK